MKSEEVISYISIAIIAISLFFIGTELTGFVTTYNDTAVVNVTIESTAGISFTTAVLDFGAGSVTPGQSAVLDSFAGTGTYWSGASNTSSELVLVNIGNENLTLEIKTDKTAQEFIGGTGEAMEAKVSQTGEPGSCTTNQFATYKAITTSLQSVCSTVFAIEEANDQIEIDFKLTIPSDATVGTKTLTITAVGTGA